MSVFYNDADPKACAVLRELIQESVIPDGEVCETPIEQLRATDVSGFTRVHLFAGFGGWELALQYAGWGDDPVWTGSCPCPPFSSAGKKKRCPGCGDKPVPHPLQTGVFACVGCGHEWVADKRHLWPEFLRLIRECRPPVVFGEQVSGADGAVWLAGVRASLEAAGYGVGAVDTCSAGAGKEADGWVRRGDQVFEERVLVGNPNIRQRLYWCARVVGRVANDPGTRRGLRLSDPGGGDGGVREKGRGCGPADCRNASGVPNAEREPPRQHQSGSGPETHGPNGQAKTDGQPERCGPTGRLGDADGDERDGAHGRAAAEAGGGGDDPERGERGRAGEPARAGVLLSRPAGADHPVNTGGAGRQERVGDGGVQPGTGRPLTGQAPELPSHPGGAGYWSDFLIVECRDRDKAGNPKYRRIPRVIEPGVFDVADGLPDGVDALWTAGIHPLAFEKIEGRAALLRGFGNAICPQVAAGFVRAYLDRECQADGT